MRWEKPGVADTRATTDEAECRTMAKQEAVRLYPYGNGPPLYGAYRQMSMLQWTMMIDRVRYYAEEDLARSCMGARGYARVPASPAAGITDK